MPARLSLRHLNRATLARQGLLERQVGTVSEVVGRLAGLQAQHANAPYVALWSRREGQTIPDLEKAIEDRKVVKATLMRTTLHLVDADDFHVLDLAAAQSRLAAWAPAARKSNVDLLELNRLLLDYCAEPRTVAEIEAHLQGIAPGKLAGSHIPTGVRNVGYRMGSAAGGLVHVPPSGLWKSHGRASYVDARRWLGTEPLVDAEEALPTAVERYLHAYGPASAGDMLKWMGERRITTVRKAVEALGDRIIHYLGPDDRRLVDLADYAVPDEKTAVSGRFLSRWDSVLIAYEVRDRILPDAHREAVIKKNGDFLPTFLVDGLVAGLWSVEEADDRAVLTMEPFARVPPGERRALEEEGERLVRFVAADAAEHVVRWDSV